MLVYIQQHLDEPLELERLARLAHFSPCHFHRVFRGMVGEGLHEHIRRLRLERAAARLAMTAHPVTRLVPDEVEPEGEIGIQDVGQGDYAKAIHHGPYERLSETYAMICGQWGPTSGRDFRGAPSIEIYKNDPNTTPPEELVTEVYVPLE